MRVDSVILCSRYGCTYVDKLVNVHIWNYFFIGELKSKRLLRHADSLTFLFLLVQVSRSIKLHKNGTHFE